MSEVKRAREYPTLAEYIPPYFKAMELVMEDVPEEEEDDEEAWVKERRKMARALGRELQHVIKSVAPTRAAPAEGSTADQLKNLNLPGMQYEEEACAEFANMKEARAALRNAHPGWVTPMSGWRGGGNGSKQSYHVANMEGTTACKIKGDDEKGEPAKVYWLHDAAEPPAFKVRLVRAHSRAFTCVHVRSRAFTCVRTACMCLALRVRSCAFVRARARS